MVETRSGTRVHIDVKVHFPAKGWNNTIILSQQGANGKENARKRCDKNATDEGGTHHDP